MGGRGQVHKCLTIINAPIVTILMVQKAKQKPQIHLTTRVLWSGLDSDATERKSQRDSSPLSRDSQDTGRLWQNQVSGLWSALLERRGLGSAESQNAVLIKLKAPVSCGKNAGISIHRISREVCTWRDGQYYLRRKCQRATGEKNTANEMGRQKTSGTKNNGAIRILIHSLHQS